MSSPKIFLLDGHALMYRSFYAIAGLVNSKGQPTNAVYGFTSTLRKIIREHSPTHVAVCFDAGKKTKRQEKFLEYKIQRPSMPEGLISQIPMIKKIIDAYRIPIFEQEGYEADDLIATLAEKFKNSGAMVIIASDDKDMYQLVEQDIKMYSFRQDKILGTQESFDRLGIKPRLIADYIGLCGDTADNIPGVKGVGEVTARALINQYESLENLYAHVHEIKGSLKEKLTTQKDAAFFSKDLALLDTNAPIAISLDDLRLQEPSGEELLSLFNEFEFRKLAQELSSDQKSPGAQELCDLKNEKALSDFINHIKDAQKMSILIQSNDDRSLFRVLISASNQAAALNIDQLVQLKSLFASQEISKTVYDYKLLLKTCREEGIALNGKIYDVLLAGYLLLSGQSAIDIATIAWRYLKQTVSAEDPALFVQALEQCGEIMFKELESLGLLNLYQELELPLSKVLSDMEHEGVKIDTAALLNLSSRCDIQIQDISAKIFKTAGCEFNINSPKQLSDVLFVQLKLPVVKKTKTGFSTDEEVLSKLAPKHDIAQMILDYRQIAKLKSTYIDALPKLINPKTNRIHATFNQAGAETGRLSSNNPNLQNIPIRTQLGREVRRAFIPLEPDDLLLSADYSQIELRILAHLCQDENLLKAFKEDQDIHTYTAGLIFDVPESSVDSSMRNAAKRVNFGIIYGISAFGLAKDLGVSNAQAQDFIDRYFLRYPGVKTFMDSEIKKAQELGYVTTILNRRRYIPEINSKNIGLRQFAERQAINTPVQGSAADLMKLAMIHIHQKMDAKKFESKMLITVHDELVCNMKINEQSALIELVRNTMENVKSFAVPVSVTVKAGKNWLDMQKI